MSFSLYTKRCITRRSITSHFNRQTIVGEANVGRQLAVGIVMKTYLVGEMGEEGALGTNAARKLDSVSDEHVAMVFAFKSQGVHHERLHSLQQLAALVADGFHVGDIGKRAEAIGQDGQPVVHHLYCLPADVANLSFLTCSDGMQVKQRHTWIELLGEAIGHRHTQGVNGLLIGVDVDVAELAEPTQIVDTCHMIVVDVGDEHAVDLPKRQRHELHANIGTTIDEHTRRSRLQKACTTIAAVTRIAAMTHLARASQHGYAR